MRTMVIEELSIGRRKPLEVCIEGLGCWEVISHWRNSQGYVSLGIIGSSPPEKERAHRLIWKHRNGKIPKGMCICHQCDNPPCINPNHLFIGTQAKNIEDRESKGRGNTTRGEDTGLNKLSEEEVLQIRRLGIYAKQTTIAKWFNISQTQVCRIIKKTRWAHI